MQTTTLAVLMHADIVGSTRLVQRDERVAHERIQTAFKLFADAVVHHGGKVREIRGDALVAEFSRASDAVSAALVGQAQNLQSNNSLTDEIRPVMRVGIALGEVVVADNTVTGAGVVLAQRLEQLASGGAVCISGAIREALPARLQLTYEALGEHRLKGFDTPTLAYQVSLEDGVHLPAPAVSPERSSGTERAEQGRLSIVVLPFANLSSDSEQQHFADGITEDIIAALTRIRQFFVVARNTSFQYKDQSVDIKQLAAGLGVRYVVEGSVRTSGARARITAQLVDGHTGNPIWSERFDHQLTDIFEVQDAITRALVGHVGAQLRLTEQERAMGKPPGNLDAWELYYRGMHFLYKRTAEANREARTFFEQAISKDPGFASPYSAMARSYAVDWAVLGILEAGPEAALNLAKRGVELDPRDSVTHLALGIVHWMVSKDADAALRAFLEAHRINPNDVQILHGIAGSYISAGQADAALPHLESAIELGRADSMAGLFYARMSFAQFFLGAYEQAVEWSKMAISKGVPPIERTPLIAALAELGRSEDARRFKDELSTLWRDMSLDGIRVRTLVSDPHYLKLLLDALRKADVPN